VKLISTILPSLLVGGLLFGNAVGQADDGRALIAQQDTMPTPPTPPTAPTPPTPPTPRTPKPPKAPKVPKAGGGSGFSINVHDGKVQIDGLDQFVDQHINQAMESIAQDPNIPAPVRAKVTAKMEKIRAKVKARLGHLDASDMDQVGEELDKLGEEISDEMDDFGSDMDQYGKDMDKWGKNFEKDFGKKFGKDFAKKFGNMNMQVGPNAGSDDDVDPPDPPDVDDDSDMADAVRDLGDLDLKQPQRNQLKQLRTDSDAKVAAAKRELDRVSKGLEKQLSNPNASDADISRSIDAVAQQEAAIRKARILAWVNARRILDDSQRQKVEAVAKGRHH
jgi:hypothetical protein